MADVTKEQIALKKMMDIVEEEFPHMVKYANGKEYTLVDDGKRKRLYLFSPYTKAVLDSLAVKEFVTAGQHFGDFEGNTFTPSLSTLYKYMQVKNKFVVVREFAAQHFLFGRNINAKSVVNFDKSLRPDDKAFIYDEENRPLGYGIVKSTLARPTEGETAVKHAVDFGWFIRNR